MKSKAFFLWLLLLVPPLLMVGCEKDESSDFQSQGNQNKGSETVHPTLTASDVEANLPIPIEEGEFDKVYGWIDKETIVYTTNIQDHTNVYAYNLKEGTNTLMTESELIINSIYISDSGKFLLIHSSSSTSENMITVIKNDGKEVYSNKIIAFDVAIKWNPYNEQKILISTFTEDWQARTFLLSIEDQKMTEIELSNPFSYWLTENELTFLDWEQENISLFAEVVLKNLASGKEKDIFPNIFQMDTFKNTLMTITIEQDRKGESVFQFYQNDNFQLIGSFSMPQLTRFSDWLVPYYDFDQLHNEFIAFQPLYSGEVDMYNEGFQLFEYELGGKDKQLIMEGLDNEPISCSPAGNLCLYGYYFEKLIDLGNKKIIKLVS